MTNMGVADMYIGFELLPKEGRQPFTCVPDLGDLEARLYPERKHALRERRVAYFGRIPFNYDRRTSGGIDLVVHTDSEDARYELLQSLSTFESMEVRELELVDATYGFVARSLARTSVLDFQEFLASYIPDFVAQMREKGTLSDDEQLEHWLSPIKEPRQERNNSNDYVFSGTIVGKAQGVFGLAGQIPLFAKRYNPQVFISSPRTYAR